MTFFPHSTEKAISNDFISNDQDLSHQDLILKHNLAQLFVMTIENPEKLIQQDFSPLLDSLLMRTMNQDKTKNLDLIHKSLNLIVELEAYRFISYQNQTHTRDTNLCLFAPSGKAWKSLTDYQLSEACQALIGEGEYESCWFDRMCSQVNKDVELLQPHLDSSSQATNGFVALCRFSAYIDCC